MKIFRSKIMKIILIISGILLIFALWIYAQKLAWTPEVYIKEDFTEEEQDTIIEILEEKFDNVANVQIDYIRYSSARETLNLIYISNANWEMINENYKSNIGDEVIETPDGEAFSGTRYWKADDYRTECVIYETGTDTKAVIWLYSHYEELYDIVRTGPQKEDTLFLIAVLMLAVGVGCCLIKRSMKGAKS